MTQLQEISPDAFARRALMPYPRRASALVVQPAALEIAVNELRDALGELNISFVQAELDGQLRGRKEALGDQHPTAVVVTSQSEDPELWRRIDQVCSRLYDDSTTLLLLSYSAAEIMSHNAPNLVSRLGTLWAYQSSTLDSLIDDAAGARYPELYEPVDDRPAVELEQTTEAILSAFGDPQADDVAWRRFGNMGRALLIEVMPTIAGHWPQGTGPAKTVLAALEQWLASASMAPVPTVPSLSNLIDGPRAPQAVAEAIDVVRNAARLTDRAHAREAIADIIDDCLQGYAIFPGSADRRRLFDWWLQVVVPATWALRHPDRFHGATPQS